MSVFLVHSSINPLSILLLGGYLNSFVIPIREIAYDIKTFYHSGVVILSFVQLLERGEWT